MREHGKGLGFDGATAIKPLSSGDELLAYFRQCKHYQAPQTLVDRKVGFSIQRAYPNDIRYKPPITGTGQADVVAIIHVVYEHPRETGVAQFDPTAVPITVRIGKFSRYRMDHIDYDFSDELSPTEESLARSKRTPQPLEMNYLEEFYFDQAQGAFFTVSHKQLSGCDLLDLVFQAHCDTVHTVKGFGVRSRVKARSVVLSSISGTVTFFKFALEKALGRTLDEGAAASAFLKGYEKGAMKKLSTDSLNIFGYQAAKSVIVVFCGGVVILFSFKYHLGLHYPYAKTIFSNDFLAVTHSIFLMWLIDAAAPHGLLYAINVLIRLRTHLMFRGIRGKKNKRRQDAGVARRAQ